MDLEEGSCESRRAAAGRRLVDGKLSPMDPLPPVKPGSSWASKHPGAGKWILLGLGGGLGILVLAGIFGFLRWREGKEVELAGEQGAAYLRGRPEIAAEIGTVRNVERKPLRKDLTAGSDPDEAWIGYALTGEKATADAEVRLVKSDGLWKPIGALLLVGGKTVSIGNPGAPSSPR